MNAIVVDKLCSFEDYLQYDDGTDNRYELVNGKLEIMNPPTIRHLLIADFIRDSLKAEINRKKLPWLCFKEAGVRTGFRKSRLTDICVVLQEQVIDLLDKSAVFQTPPLLVIEVVSPESINRDYRYKRSEYAAAEIPEYWIIDPILNKLSVLRLEEGFYEETILTASQPIVSQVFPELTLTVDQVLAAGNLDA
ncbi:Uma2 family endonuclease [Phormidium pseudopriestleyi FRX01]|uniref:Uma2 family endonuclease n=1 Tax=Phormidium pseudopriestleyi FRX01 TaxID=1759528 RepID=A0ABS3FWK3_9CYAN|nr:Uma2 family endonuclease [Phormidium pseudopriestleyi]MBO0351513.1 Uma2 family endonuclease [Phormidium pseudopriestleyi FRX01]